MLNTGNHGLTKIYIKFYYNGHIALHKYIKNRFDTVYYNCIYFSAAKFCSGPQRQHSTHHLNAVSIATSLSFINKRSMNDLTDNWQ